MTRLKTVYFDILISAIVIYDRNIFILVLYCFPWMFEKKTCPWVLGTDSTRKVTASNRNF